MNDSNHNLPTQELSKITYRLDLVRGAFRGIITAGTQTFALFIAIRYYQAGDFAKAMVGSAPFMGMFLSLFAVHYLSRTGWSKSSCAALPGLFCGLALIASAMANTIFFYTLFIVLGFIFLHLLTPFLTAIYHDNYPPAKRGSYYSTPMIFTVVMGVGFGFLGSSFMDLNLGSFKWILVILGLAAWGKTLAIWKMPSGPIEPGHVSNPFDNLKYIFIDKSFGYVLLTWFIMGFANLWVLPLRVDYLTSPTYGIEGSALMVATLITVIPDSMRALSIPFLARMFDRVNFIILRMVLNTLFGLGIALFFLTTNPVVIGMGSVLIGIAFGGGSIAWALWVTKYAPPDKVAAYMSVHVFLTGVRGTLGPLLGFWAVKHIGPVNIGFVSCGLMLLATVMLIPEIRHGNRGNSS